MSTAFLGLGLLGFPFADLSLPAPRVFPAGSQSEFVLNWIFYDLPVLLLGIVFVVAFITIIVLILRRRWRSIPQHILEMVISFVCAIFLPVY